MRARLRRPLLAFSSVVALASCAVDFSRHFDQSGENCGNAEDDDLDGVVDCEDEGCGCVPGPPEGWEGLVTVHLGSSTGCPDGRSLVEGGSVCIACACEGSVSCGAPTLAFGDGSCAQPVATAPAGGGECVLDPDISGGLTSVLGALPTATPACTAVGGGVNPGVLCSVTAGEGCSEGRVCASTREAICVHRPGDWPCPAEYPVRSHLVAGGGVAACTPCACNADAAACGGSTSLYAGEGCTGTEIVVVHDGNDCKLFTETPQSLRHVPAAPPACSAAGGLPEGGVIGRTVCCSS